MRGLFLALIMAVVIPAEAQQLIMTRSLNTFPETMLNLQEAIADQGYTISRVQRVDIGLTKMGYETDKYRVVFFGKRDEVHRLGARYPGLLPLLPLKISIFAEGNQTLMVAANPTLFTDLYDHPELHQTFARWQRDMRTIIEQAGRIQ